VKVWPVTTPDRALCHTVWGPWRAWFFVRSRHHYRHLTWGSHAAAVRRAEDDDVVAGRGRGGRSDRRVVGGARLVIYPPPPGRLLFVTSRSSIRKARGANKTPRSQTTGPTPFAAAFPPLAGAPYARSRGSGTDRPDPDARALPHDLRTRETVECGSRWGNPSASARDLRTPRDGSTRGGRAWRRRGSGRLRRRGCQASATAPDHPLDVGDTGGRAGSVPRLVILRVEDGLVP